MKLPSQETVILWVSAVLLVLVLFWIGALLTGCTATKATHLDILCVGPDGQVFHANGISAKQATKLENDWSFAACEVSINETVGGR